MNLLTKILASGFGVGYFPLAPGTLGTLLSAFIYWYLFPKNNLLILSITALTAVISLEICSKAENAFGIKDDKRIIIDEIVGFWITMLFLPKRLEILFTAVVLFRFFDIYKPLIIKKVQSFKGGYGIMLDDILAGVFANIVLHAFYYINKLV
ncbi:MAG: phosphatidylglycerophosphatase A [Endomicrobiales bacterium]|nr:phosphatidylglycerophosphatase A [Endomicrobiales bacterium]